MLSPAGINGKPVDFNLDEAIAAFPAERRMPKFVYKWSKKVWAKKLSPFKLMRKFGKFFVKGILKSFVKKRIRSD